MGEGLLQDNFNQNCQINPQHAFALNSEYRIHLNPATVNQTGEITKKIQQLFTFCNEVTVRRWGVLLATVAPLSLSRPQC